MRHCLASEKPWEAELLRLQSCAAQALDRKPEQQPYPGKGAAFDLLRQWSKEDWQALFAERLYRMREAIGDDGVKTVVYWVTPEAGPGRPSTGEQKAAALIRKALADQHAGHKLRRANSKKGRLEMLYRTYCLAEPLSQAEFAKIIAGPDYGNKNETENIRLLLHKGLRKPARQ